MYHCEIWSMTYSFSKSKTFIGCVTIERVYIALFIFFHKTLLTNICFVSLCNQNRVLIIQASYHVTTRTLDQREAKSSHFYNSIHNHSKKAVLYKSVHGDDVRLKEKALIFYSHFQPKPKNHGEQYFLYKKQNGNKINPAQIC